MAEKKGVEWHDGMVGQRIYRVRRIRRMSVKEAARGAVTPQHLNKLERGEHAPTPASLEKIARNLSTSAEFLAKGPKPPTGYLERAVWITNFFGPARNDELRELFKEQPPSSGRDRMIWLQEKLKTAGPRALKSRAEQLIEIQAEKARYV